MNENTARQMPVEWYSGNLVGVPTPLLASTAFNSHPVQLSIHGTRETHPGLFARLNKCHCQWQAADVFAAYMDLHYGHNLPEDAGQNLPHRFSTSYVELLRGWGFDANASQGAVLKGWVESRFGLLPSFHKSALRRFPSPAWVAYLEEKACSRFHNNCINFQLDALYEYCQWSLQRFVQPEIHHLTLWRGTYDGEEQVVEGSLKERECVMRLNNLVSFSASHERAEEFGDWILRTDVPLTKLLFFPGLLSDSVLGSEREYLVIGGNYVVRAWHGYL